MSNAALRRAVETELHCAATVWFRNTKTDEPYRWVACELAPGHDCEHANVDSDGNRWAHWAEGCVPVAGYRDTYAEVFHHTEPSPWTEDELNELAAVGGTYNNVS